VRVISVAALLGEAMARMTDGRPVSALFDGVPAALGP
jgi:phosphoribosylpyrophosphate synthetase